MTHKTHSLFLGCSLLLGCGLLLRSSLLLGSSRLTLLGGGSLGGGAKLEGSLVLGKFTIGNSLVQGFQVHAVHPLLILGKVGLHVLLDSNGGGSGTVLEGGDGIEDSCFVRHDDSGWMLLICGCNDNKFREDERGLVHVYEWRRRP